MNNKIVNDKLFLNLFELFKNKIHKTNENLVVLLIILLAIQLRSGNMQFIQLKDNK